MKRILMILVGLLAEGCSSSTTPSARCHYRYTVWQDTTAAHTGKHMVPMDSVKVCYTALDAA